jgi:hypothetical protein
MAYLAASAFRAGSLQWYTAGLALTEVEAPTADITSAIASYSQQFDRWCDDHFEAEAALAVVVDVREVSRHLYLPKRVRSVTQVETIDGAGVATVETLSKVRVHSSLNTAGTEQVGKLDWLEILSGESLSTGAWPVGTGTVRVTGNWSYATCPDNVKLAIAMLVYDRFRAKGDSLYRVQRWTAEGASFDRSLTEPTGLPEVDTIIEQMRRAA